MSFVAITAQEAVSTKEISFGNANGEYQIVAYYDLQCGSCVGFHKGLKKAIERFPDKVHVVIRHFPLPMHNQAFMASTVVEAANRQGKGLEMIEVLLNNQQRWSPAERPFSFIFGYVKQLGLDEKKFREEVQGDDVAFAVLYDVRRAKSLGVSSTPTVFLNGKQLSYPEALDIENIISKGNK